MTLKEIQQFSLEILRDVHRFCMANDIKYSLAYGTQIGAIRHQGFIPWDDDIDIIMARPDFEKFISTYPKSGRFKIAKPGECYLGFGRVYDTKLTKAKTKLPWRKGGSGLWIDIFPIDSVPDDHEEFLRWCAQMRELSRRQLRKRSLKAPFLKMRWKRRFQLLTEGLTLTRSLRKTVQKHQKMIKSIPYGSTQHVSQMGYPENAHKKHFPLEMMQEYIEVDFEGEKFLSIKDYDTYLRATYGDYMKLPPIEEQVPLQSSYIKFYWKNKKQNTALKL